MFKKSKLHYIYGFALLVVAIICVFESISKDHNWGEFLSNLGHSLPKTVLQISIFLFLCGYLEGLVMISL